MDPARWINCSPGNHSIALPEVTAGDPVQAVDRAAAAFDLWKRTSLEERKAALTVARDRLRESAEELAMLIAREVGKPLREARLEIAAAIAKFELTFADADLHLAERGVTDGPHPGAVRSRPRGVAAVVAPFNFPVHLGHGAAVAYLLAGNPVVFKPSPLAANVGAAYGRIMSAALPPGVFDIVQGWTGVSRRLCLDPRVRSVCFTGSLAAGRKLAVDLAEDISKSLALELGGRNCLIVCEDADLLAAASAAADGICLTTGQRCNSTSRILVAEKVLPVFVAALREALAGRRQGDPCSEETMLGPLVSSAALDRYRSLISTPGDWIVPGRADAGTGHFAAPAVIHVATPDALGGQEFFCPVAQVETFADIPSAIALQKADTCGLTASVFTEDEGVFGLFADDLEVGNLYCNLPTTFSPSTLPFGGILLAGNAKPGGRGFARFAAHEQAVQWKS